MKTVFGLALAVALGALAPGATRADEEVGPHKGIVVEWGDEEYHIELVIDNKDGTVTAYVYGDHKELKAGKVKAIETKALTLAIKSKPPVTVKLEAAPEKDDPKDRTSKFTGKSDALKKVDPAKLEGTVSGKVGKKPYTGDFPGKEEKKKDKKE